LRVLVLGAGVIGSVYGSQLGEAGHSVSVFEHGASTSNVAREGLVVRDVAKSTTQTAHHTPVAVVADSGDRYELVLVCVWADQIASVFDSLRQLAGSPVLLFFGNNPGGHATVARDLPGTVHLGFPGVGGSTRDGVVEFVRIPQQPTTLELGGGPVVDEFEAALKRQGFATTRAPDMDGWLAYHGVFVASIAAALYRCHGDANELARDRDTLILMCQSIEEGFGALLSQGVAGLPRNLRTLHRPWLRPIAVRYWARTMRSPMGERCFAAHARHAESEMRTLAVAAVRRTEDSPRTDHLHQLLG
jgi:2-dehydropantoate 2-reductase